MKNRKYFLNKSVLLVTSRMEEGLPLVPTHLMNFIIWSILAKAGSMYQVKVCHFLFMANHFHLVLVVENPQHISPFVGYIKAETAHAVNRLLGRRRKTVWDDGYDSPILLTADDVVRYIKYTYLNPAKANLVKTIDHYPGVSSWELFSKNKTKRECKHLSRTDIEPLDQPALSINEQKRMVADLDKLERPTYTFKLEPNAWMDSFSAYEGCDPAIVNKAITDDIETEEDRLEGERKKLGREVLGSTTLRRQSMLKEHTPSKYSRKMICLCNDKDLRYAFIDHYKEVCFKARTTYEKWKQGDLAAKIPLGLIAPALPTLADAISFIT